MRCGTSQKSSRSGPGGQVEHDVLLLGVVGLLPEAEHRVVTRLHVVDVGQVDPLAVTLLEGGDPDDVRTDVECSVDRLALALEQAHPHDGSGVVAGGVDLAADVGEAVARDVAVVVDLAASVPLGRVGRLCRQQRGTQTEYSCCCECPAVELGVLEHVRSFPTESPELDLTKA